MMMTAPERTNQQRSKLAAGPPSNDELDFIDQKHHRRHSSSLKLDFPVHWAIDIGSPLDFVQFIVTESPEGLKTKKQVPIQTANIDAPIYARHAAPTLISAASNYFVQ